MTEKGVKGGRAEQLDQFFTKKEVARRCVSFLELSITKWIAEFDMVVEPSFGKGAFVETLLEDAGVLPEKMVCMDIDACDDTLRRDFLGDIDDIIPPDEYSHDYTPRKEQQQRKRTKMERKKLCLTVGNPPFGKSSSLAVKFFNQAAQFSSVIAFIVPKTFRKESLRKKLDRHFLLVSEKDIPDDSFVFEDCSRTVPAVFQVWVNVLCTDLAKSLIDVSVDGLRPQQPSKTDTNDFEFVKRNGNPDYAIQRVGVFAGEITYGSGIQNKSEASHVFVRVKDRTQINAVSERLYSLNLKSAYIKYQNAGCPSISKKEICSLYQQQFGPKEKNDEK